MNKTTRLEKGRLPNSRTFLAHEGRSDLSQEELQKLFAQFLEWERRAKN
jgi:hypothetical protein